MTRKVKIERRARDYQLIDLPITVLTRDLQKTKFQIKGTN